MNKTEYLLILLIDVVIATYSYVNLDEYKKRLDALKFQYEKS